MKCTSYTFYSPDLFFLPLILDLRIVYFLHFLDGRNIEGEKLIKVKGACKNKKTIARKSGVDSDRHFRLFSKWERFPSFKPVFIQGGRFEKQKSWQNGELRFENWFLDGV